MQITHIFKTYFPNTHGGLEEAIRQIARASVEEGISVSVVSLSKKAKEEIHEGVKTQSFYANFEILSNPFSWSLLKHFRTIIKNSDIIHLQFPWPTAELLTLLFNVKKPIVLTFHCDIHKNKILKKLYEPFIHAVLRKSSVIVVTSENLKRATPILQGYRHKCRTVNLWLDKDRFDGLSEPDQAIIDMVKEIGVYGLFVGVLRWYKGLNILLDAAKNTKGNIVILGNGLMLDELKKRIKEEKISNVFVLGFQNDSALKYLLENCRFTVLPSISPAEAFGQVLLESCYFKKPMVTTELGTGTSFVNLNGQTGYVIPRKDVSSLFEAMNKLFVSEVTCEMFGQNAYNRLQEYFTLNKQAKKYIEIYKSLL